MRPIRLAALVSVDGQWRAGELPDLQEAAQDITELGGWIGEQAKAGIQKVAEPVPQVPIPDNR